jgi:hypothetical protein
MLERCAARAWSVFVSTVKKCYLARGGSKS